MEGVPGSYAARPARGFAVFVGVRVPGRGRSWPVRMAEEYGKMFVLFV